MSSPIRFLIGAEPTCRRRGAVVGFTAEFGSGDAEDSGRAGLPVGHEAECSCGGTCGCGGGSEIHRRPWTGGPDALTEADGSADEGWGGTGCTGGDIDHITAVYNAGTGECDLTTYCADGTAFANKRNPHEGWSACSQCTPQRRQVIWLRPSDTRTSPASTRASPGV
jgi:hypothetical protein